MIFLFKFYNLVTDSHIDVSGEGETIVDAIKDAKQKLTDDKLLLKLMDNFFFPVSVIMTNEKECINSLKELNNKAYQKAKETLI